MQVVATYESGLPITHEETGLVIETANSQSIVDAIIRLKNDGALRQKIGVSAARMMKANYTWDDYAKNMCQIYLSH